jgi:hypothetical protein
MLRTVIVTVGGAILSLLLLSFAMYLILNHTQFGHLATGNTQGISDPWKTFTSGFWVLFFGVSLPVTMLVATFVGAFANKHVPVAALVAVLPIAIISSGLELKGIWVTAVLVLNAMLVATGVSALTKAILRTSEHLRS